MAATINVLKEASESAKPVHLFLFTWATGATLAVCSHALTYDGVDFLPRVMAQRLDPIQALSPHGIEIPGSVQLTLADADKDMYTIDQSLGFRGARLRVTFGFYDFVEGEWSADTIVPFIGRCDRPEVTDDALIVTASFILNLEAKMLPSFPIQPRCPKLFPATAAQKALADVKGSPYYPCGVSDPAKTFCTFDKEGCALNNNDSRFGGLVWEVPPASRSREYVSGNWLTDLVSDPNAGKYGDYAPIGYGTGWVDCIVLGTWPEGNSTRGEAIVCEGRPAAILKVVVNDVELPAATDLDGNPYHVADPLLRYNVVSSGDRDGDWNDDAPWNGEGDPHGSQCVIEWVVYNKLTSTTPRVRALVQFPKVQTYAKISNVTGGVVTLADNAPNTDIAGNPPYSITIFGNSNGALNATFGLTSWAYGPPGTVTLSGSSASGTGGYIAYESSSDQYAWVILDVLRRAGLRVDDVDFDSFINAANRHRVAVDFTARDGSAQTHAKYTCAMVLRQRRSAADIVTGMVRGCNSHLGRNLATGKVALFARGAIAEQQPAAQDGSNDNVAVAGGYVAYHFDESSMIRDQSAMTRAGRGAGSLPNVVTIGFANEENDHSGDSVEVVDADDINLMRQQIPGSLTVDGCTALDRAHRIGAAYLAEQLGGDLWRWSTTHKAVRLRVGQIIAVSSVKHGFERALMRLQSIAPAANWETCAIEASVHVDGWYADDYGEVTGNPATGPRRDRLARPSFPWAPYQVQPDAADPLFDETDWTFGLQLVYETLRDGSPQATATIKGKKPVNEPQNLQPPVVAAQGTTADLGGSVPGGGAVWFVAVAGRLNGKPGPISRACQVVVAQAGDDNTITAAVGFWDPANDGYFVFVGRSAQRLVATNDAGYSGAPATVTVTTIPETTWGAPDTEYDRTLILAKVCWHAGVFGAALSGVGERTLEIAGAGWPVDQWAGYDCMVLAKADLSELGVWVYRVLSNTAEVLTVRTDSPDPEAAGLVAGDVLVMMSKPAVAGLVVTDANWENTLSNAGLGMAVHEEKGRILRVIAGPGRGYKYPIADNTTTAITIVGPWVVAPTAASRYVIEDAAVLPDRADSTPVENDDPQAVVTLTVPVRNYAGKTLLFEAVTLDGGGNESAAHRNPVRMAYVPGAQGTRTVTADDTQLVTDWLILCDTTAGDIEFQLLPAAAAPNQELTIQKISGDANTVTIVADPGDADLIDGQVSIVLAEQWDKAFIKANG